MGDKIDKKILIIEDDISVLDIYAKELKFAGFTVFTAMDTDEGYGEIRENKPDLILLDIMLPGESGLEFLKQLKNNESTKDVKVIMLTNLDASAVMDEGYKLGVDAYFVKAQFVPSQITTEIKSLLGV